MQRHLIRFILAALFVAGAGIFFISFAAPGALHAAEDAWLAIFRNRHALRDFILSAGRFSSILFVFIQAAQVVLSPIPGEATGFIAGFVFGTWKGFALSMAGLVAGSMLAFFIARLFRRRVRKWLESSFTYARFERLIEHQGIFVFFFLFVFPGFPKDMLCYFLGLSRMPWQVFLIITGMGRIPGTMMLAMQGSSIYEGDIVRISIVFGVTALLALPAWLLRDRLYSRMDAMITGSRR